MCFVSREVILNILTPVLCRRLRSCGAACSPVPPPAVLRRTSLVQATPPPSPRRFFQTCQSSVRGAWVPAPEPRVPSPPIYKYICKRGNPEPIGTHQVYWSTRWVPGAIGSMGSAISGIWCVWRVRNLKKKNRQVRSVVRSGVGAGLGGFACRDLQKSPDPHAIFFSGSNFDGKSLKIGRAGTVFSEKTTI